MPEFNGLLVGPRCTLAPKFMECFLFCITLFLHNPANKQTNKLMRVKKRKRVKMEVHKDCFLWAL